MELKEVRGKGLSKNVPRYIDYGVIALISIGLAQIYFSEDVFAKYIEQISGTKEEIVTNIRNKAAAHQIDDCRQKEGFDVELCKKLGLENCTQNGGFTVEYCRKLDEIVSSKNLDAYILTTLSKDSEFLDHIIGYISSPQGPVAIKSPIAKYVNQYVALGEYGVGPQNPDRKSTWSWLTLVLLPFILSLRATKTSLELYGDLQ